MKLTRPLCTMDCESTGVEPTRDRIVTLYILKEHPDGREEELDLKFNPGITMCAEVIAIHGIDNAMCAAWPAFETEATRIHEFIKGCDIHGFNIEYDSTMVWEALYRCGIEWDVSKIHKIDSGLIFKKKEQRTLTAAVKFYCKRDHAGAHGAKDDALATRDVLNAQINRYEDLLDLDVAGLEKASQYEPRADLNGTIAINEQGVPVFNTRRNKGVPVLEDRGYAEWFLRSDFPQQTKHVIRAILGSASEDGQGLFA